MIILQYQSREAEGDHMKVYVVTGYNDILNSFYVAGVSKSKETAEKIKEEDEFQATLSRITEVEVSE